MIPLPFLVLILYITDFSMCYQRLSVNNNNHNNVDQKPTHLPPIHYPHGHKWSEPYFDLTMPKNITSLVGKSAYLGCRVKHLGNKTVAWIRHRDLHILTVGTYTYTTDQRFQTSYHRDIDEWTLQIKWAQQRDAGVYECQISTQPVRSFSVNLNIVDTMDSEKNNLLQQYYNDDTFYISSDRVYQASDDEFAGMFGPIQTVAVPTATILGGPDLYVDRGSTINLTCVIKFSPEPPTHIFWYHQDKVLSEETSGGRLKFKTIKSEETKSILLIDDADLLDSGKYSCYPSNTEIASIRVHVLQGERPEAMQTNIATTVLHNATQPAKLISTMVALFALLQIFTFFINSRNANYSNTNATTTTNTNTKTNTNNKNNKSNSENMNINNTTTTTTAIANATNTTKTYNNNNNNNNNNNLNNNNKSNNYKNHCKSLQHSKRTRSTENNSSNNGNNKIGKCNNNNNNNNNNNKNNNINNNNKIICNITTFVIRPHSEWYFVNTNTVNHWNVRHVAR